MSKIQSKVLSDIPNPTPEEIDACLAEARRLRSESFGKALVAGARTLARPFHRKAKDAKHPHGSLPHSA